MQAEIQNPVGFAGLFCIDSEAVTPSTKEAEAWMCDFVVRNSLSVPMSQAGTSSENEQKKEYNERKGRKEVKIAEKPHR